MSVVSKTRVLQLLGSGLGTDLVATAVGCDPSYISQLLADDEFADEVAKLRSEALLVDSSRDRSIGSIEDKLINQLHIIIDDGLIYKPRDVLQAFSILNRAQRRGVSAAGGTTVKNTVVNITLPTNIMNNYVTNAQGEVVDVNGQTLVAMPAMQLLKQLAGGELKNEGAGDENRYDKVSRYLPAVNR